MGIDTHTNAGLVLYAGSGGGQCYMDFNWEGSGKAGDQHGRILYNANGMYFQTDGAMRMFIKSSGEVGIGTIAPSGGRLVIGGALTETRLVVDGVNSHSGSGQSSTQTAVLLKHGDHATGFGNEGQIAFSYKDKDGANEGWKHFIHTRHQSDSTTEEKKMKMQSTF